MYQNEPVFDQGPSTTTVNTAYCSTFNVFLSLFANMSSDTHRGLKDITADVQQPVVFPANALETNPLTNIPHGNIPNTPLASSTISFLLGSTFIFGLYTAVNDISNTAGLLTYQLGCFIAAWAFFHWAEFAVTAGWNFEKCSVDCQSFFSRKENNNNDVHKAYLLDNGAMYHIANGAALLEYLLSLYIIPSGKSWPYVSQIGMLQLSVFTSSLFTTQIIQAQLWLLLAKSCDPQP